MTVSPPTAAVSVTGTPLHSSQVLLHEPVGSDGTPGLWEAQASLRATVRAEDAPYVERHGFVLYDLGAFTFLADTAFASQWSFADGRVVGPGAGRSGPPPVNRGPRPNVPPAGLSRPGMRPVDPPFDQDRFDEGLTDLGPAAEQEDRSVVLDAEIRESDELAHGLYPPCPEISKREGLDASTILREGYDTLELGARRGS